MRASARVVVDGVPKPSGAALRGTHDVPVLLCSLAWRDVKVRYKAPWLGAVWAFMVPLAVSAVLMVVFGRVLPPIETRASYFLFVLSAMFPWHFFQEAVVRSTTSIQDNAELIQKVAFPRVTVPLGVVAGQSFNFFCALSVLTLLVAFGRGLHVWGLLLPLAVALLLFFATGVSLLVAGLQVAYRDVKYLVEVGLWMWFYLTPVFYPMTLAVHQPGLGADLYLANPMVSLVSLFRVALTGPEGAGLMPGMTVFHCLGQAALSACAFLMAGWWVFRHHEPAFADLVQ